MLIIVIFNKSKEDYSLLFEIKRRGERIWRSMLYLENNIMQIKKYLICIQIAVKKSTIHSMNNKEKKSSMIWWVVQKQSMDAHVHIETYYKSNWIHFFPNSHVIISINWWEHFQHLGIINTMILSLRVRITIYFLQKIN